MKTKPQLKKWIVTCRIAVVALTAKQARAAVGRQLQFTGWADQEPAYPLVEPDDKKTRITKTERTQW